MSWLNYQTYNVRPDGLFFNFNELNVIVPGGLVSCYDCNWFYIANNATKVFSTK